MKNRKSCRKLHSGSQFLSAAIQYRYEIITLHNSICNFDFDSRSWPGKLGIKLKKNYIFAFFRDWSDKFILEWELMREITMKSKVSRLCMKFCFVLFYNVKIISLEQRQEKVNEKQIYFQCYNISGRFMMIIKFAASFISSLNDFVFFILKLDVDVECEYGLGWVWTDATQKPNLLAETKWDFSSFQKILLFCFQNTSPKLKKKYISTPGMFPQKTKQGCEWNNEIIKELKSVEKLHKN